MCNDHIFQYKPNYILKVVLLKKNFLLGTHIYQYSVYESQQW